MLFLLLVTIVGGYVGAFRIFNINKKASEYLNEKISQSLGIEVTSESVTILPWSVTINDIRLNLLDSPGIYKNIPLHIEAKRMRIGFNILTLLKNRFRPVYGTLKIFIDDPEFIWLLGNDRGTASVQDSSKTIEKPEFTFQNLPSLRINIVNGSFVFQRSDSTFVFADHVSGWMDGDKTSVVELNVEGRILSENLNMSCKGFIDKSNKDISIELLSSGCNLANDGIGILFGDILSRSGTLGFDIKFERKNDLSTLVGNYTLADGSFALKDLNIGVTDLHIDGHLNENEVFFDSVSGNIWDVNPKLSGHIKLKPEPTLEFVLNADRIDISRALSDIFPGKNMYPEGTMDLSAALDGPIANLSARANVAMDSLRYHKENLSGISASMNYSQGVLTLEHMNALYRGYDLSGSGSSKIASGSDSKDIDLVISAHNPLISETVYSVQLNGNVNVPANEYYSDLKIKTNDNSDELTASIVYIDDNLDYRAAHEYMELTGTIRSLQENAEISSNVIFTQMPALKYLGLGDNNLTIDGKGTVEGTFDKIIVDGDFRLLWGNNLNSLLTGNAAFENIFEPSRTFTVDAQIIDHHLRHSKPMTWDLSAESDFKKIESVVTDSEGAELAFNLYPESRELAGRLDLTDFPLEWIIDIFAWKEFSHKGKINGHAILSGTMTEPFFETPEDLTVTEMTLGGLNRLEGTVYVSGRPGELNFLDVDLKRNEIHILHGDGRWKSGTPFILEAEGIDVELGAISDLISSTRITGGTTNYSVTTEFTRKQGTIDGEFTVKNGHFFDIPFDSASGRMSGGSTGFKVSGFEIEKKGMYTGTGTAESGYLWLDKTEEPGLRMNLSLDGDLMKALPHLTDALKSASGDCRAKLEFGGSWQEPAVFGGELYIENGRFEPSFLVGEVTDVNAEIKIDPEFETVTGLRAVRITGASGLIEGIKLNIENIHYGDTGWDEIKRPGLMSIANDRINLDFGVLAGFIDTEKNRDGSFDLHVPGFMKENETGTFELSGINGNKFLIGVSNDGDEITPYISGRIYVHSGDIHFPLIQSSTDAEKDNLAIPGFISNIFWDLEINNGSNVNYVKEKNLEFGRIAGTTLWQNEIKLSENSTFSIVRRSSDGTFRVTGNANSTSGFINYYGYSFDIEWAELELDTANSLKPAILTGRASTVVFDDSTGVETEVSLHVAFVDRESGAITEARRGSIGSEGDDYYDLNRPQTRFDAGALGILEIRFTSNNPSDNTQGKIMARLGLSAQNIGAAATRAFTAGIDSYYLNPFLRPFENRLKRIFRLDMVKITPSVLGNFAQSRLAPARSFDPGTDYILFDKSRIMLGERLTKDFFITYVGQYGISRDFLYRREKGFYHNFELQYFIDRNIRLQLRYENDDIIKREDKIFEIRYDFDF
jgi:hypothetical protein